MGKKPEYHLYLFLFSGLCLTLVVACAGAPPSISQLFWQVDVVRNLDADSQHEELSLFLMIDDADGLDDLDEVLLIQRDRELVWKLEPDEMRRVQREGEMWMGVNGIQMNDRSPLPRGNYTIEVSDRAGEKDETEFFLGRDITGHLRGDLDSGLFPELNVNSSVVTASDEEQVSVFFYDTEGNFLRSEVLPVNSFTRQVLRQWRESDIDSVWLHSYNAAEGYGLVSGPFRLAE